MLAGLSRVVLVGLIAMLTFGLFEQWPKRTALWLLIKGLPRTTGEARA